MTIDNKEIHLVVLQHGLWGVPKHFNVMLKHMEDVHGKTEIRILNSDVSIGFQTYAGIDQCGDKLVTLIEKHIAELKKKDGMAVTRISFIGYSLGGLINRYAIGKLYSKHFFDTIIPVNFITIATPHLGVRKRGLYAMERFYNSMVSILTSRTGMQVSLNDAYHKELPLLVVFCIPNLPFYKALSMFRRRQAFANIRMDRTVPFTTASFSKSNPYHRWIPEPGYGGKYPSLVKPSKRPYVKEPWTNRGRMTVAMLVALSPLLLPLYLLVAIPTLAGWSAYYHITTESYKTEWVWSEKDGEFHIAYPIVNDPNSVKTHLARREYMIATLNELEWEKIDVRTEMWHSHAAIIVRNGKDGSPDVTKYVADTFARI